MSLHTRLKRLENPEESTNWMPACIIRTFVKPGEDGPIECGAIATILVGPNSGLELERGETESREDFERLLSALLETQE